MTTELRNSSLIRMRCPGRTRRPLVRRMLRRHRRRRGRIRRPVAVPRRHRGRRGGRHVPAKVGRHLKQCGTFKVGNLATSQGIKRLTCGGGGGAYRDVRSEEKGCCEGSGGKGADIVCPVGGVDEDVVDCGDENPVRKSARLI